MQCQTHIAMLAFGHPATTPAFQQWCIPTAILEQDNLLTAGECLFHCIYKRIGKRTCNQLTSLKLLHVKYHNLGQLQ